MILRYPKHAAEVDRYSTFQLVRAKTLLPSPSSNEERAIMARIDAMLDAANPEHRKCVEQAIGYGPG